MKKLITIVAIAVSGFVNGQVDSLTSHVQSIIDLQNTEIHKQYDNTYMMYKYGDTDAKYTYGQLKSVFDNDDTRYSYSEINPRIAKLIIQFNDLDSIISFGDWIENYAGITNFESIYGNRNDYNMVYDGGGREESLTVIDKRSGEWVFYVSIFYDKFSDQSSDTWINLRSVIIVFNKKRGQ